MGNEREQYLWEDAGWFAEGPEESLDRPVPGNRQEFIPEPTPPEARVEFAPVAPQERNQLLVRDEKHPSLEKSEGQVGSVLGSMQYCPVQEMVDVSREAMAYAHAGALSLKDALHLRLSASKELIRYVASPRSSEKPVRRHQAASVLMINQSFNMGAEADEEEKAVRRQGRGVLPTSSRIDDDAIEAMFEPVEYVVGEQGDV